MTEQKRILLLGSGYVARPCAEIVLRRPENVLTIASRRLEHSQHLAQQLAESIPGASGRVSAASVDVNSEEALDSIISQHDLTISLIPYTYHAQVIKSAIKYKKHVVTTSYVNPQMAELDKEAREAGITVMNEIGVDPGIDHLWAVKKIDEVHKSGGEIVEFVSYCGGLPAPEVSNNPLGYKFSWSSRGVLLALRNSAKFIEGGRKVEIAGPRLMRSAKPIPTGYPGFNFVGYPNRDSTPYKERYNIPEAQTIIRGTLRYGGFPEFIQVLVDVGYLDESPVEWLKPGAPLIGWREVTCKLLGVDADAADEEVMTALSRKAGLDKLARADRDQMVNGFKWMGLLSPEVKVEQRGTVLDALCATLEEKMVYGPGERDMVMLQHRFLVKTAQGKLETHLSSLLEFGKPNGTTAMAKTVGVPCGIAVQLVLDGGLSKRGVIAPMSMDICQPLIDALEKEGISMHEEVL